MQHTSTAPLCAIQPADDWPRYGIIEVSTHCQLRCPGCYMVRRDQLGRTDMTLRQAVRILDQCAEYLGRELETMDILGGEPLLWAPFKEYIEILLRRGIKPWVFTNMLAITPDVARWLREREVYITGKLNVADINDPAQLAVQAEMIGRSSKVARKLLDAIKVFQQAGYKDPLFRLENLVRSRNLPYIPGFYRWCLQNDIGADIELLACGEGIDEKYWQVAPGPQQLAEMIRALQEVRRELGLEPIDVLMPHIFNPCRFYDRGLYFAASGAIRACSNSAVALAHVDDPDPIRQARRSSLICGRLCLTQGAVGEPCRSCEKWERCRGGCRATAEGQAGGFGGYTLCPVPLL